MSGLRWSAYDYAEFRRQERRDWIAEQRDQAATHAQRAKEKQAMTRKTKHGERVEKFPKVDDLKHRIGAVRTALAEAFDEADQQRDRRERMASTRLGDKSRFPTIGDGVR